MKPLKLFILLLAATFLPTTADASGSQDALSLFVSRLDEGGYSASVSQAPVTHPTLSAQGVILTADKAGAIARVELLTYSSQDRLALDWQIADQQAPKPRIATADFNGKVLIWREESILVLDFDPPNDPGTVQVVAGIFLGRRATDFHGLPPRIIPPGTGNGGLVRPKQADTMKLVMPTEVGCGETVSITALNSSQDEVIFIVFPEYGRAPTGEFASSEGRIEQIPAKTNEGEIQISGMVVPSPNGQGSILFTAPMVDRDVFLSIEVMGFRNGGTDGGAVRGLQVRGCPIKPPSTGDAGLVALNR